MSDAETAERRVEGNAPKLDKNRYLTACLAKGARRQEDRAVLLNMPRRSLVRYELCQIEPRVTVMRHIAATLDLEVEDLWPAA